MPDPATASAALQNGEIDWWETPVTDLVPVLKKNRNIKVDIADPLGNIGSFRLNHMHPPFNNIKARQAVQAALSQEDYMRAVVGSDDKLWKPIPSFFTPGTPLYTEAGGEPLKGKRDYDLAKKLLQEAGYSGQPVTCLVAQDQPPLKAMGEITADLLKKIGMTVDFVATDWGTVGQRRASKNPPGQGGWGMFHTWHAGSDCASPVGNIAIAHERREGLVRLARQCRDREGHRRLVRCQDARRGEGHHRPRQQGGHGACHLHPDRLLLSAIRPGARAWRASATDRCPGSGE